MRVFGHPTAIAFSCLLTTILAGLAVVMLLVAKTDFSLVTVILMAVVVAAVSFWLAPLQRKGLFAGVLCSLIVIAGAWSVLQYIHALLEIVPDDRKTPLGIWVFVSALGFLAWRGMQLLAVIKTHNKPLKLFLNLSIPLLFGAWLFFLWEVLTIGFSVPQVLLPPPSQIADVLVASSKTLSADFYQTFVRAMIPGFLIGCISGFLTAIAADRVPFLKRGLLPIGNLISAIPIVGIAPIMVMWFGFDWQSKAAVVAIMTFFPMMVNTLAGLAEVKKIELDLLRTYASGYWRELFSLRLPNAMPFIFNALKINSTLAMIGAIVAEFFGTPIVGMGFRISTEVGRMNIDMVWATIAIAALAGSIFYGLFAVTERVVIFWHSSMRKS